MKNFLYRLFALIFNIGTRLSLRDNLVAFVAPHPGGSHDSLGELKCYLEELGGYEFLIVNVPRKFSILAYLKFFFVVPFRLARAKFVFLNDNFMPLADMKFNKNTVVTQLWHGEGAFKKFGLLTELEQSIKERQIKAGEKLTYVICTSENVRQVYANAFGVPKEKVLPLGSARMDYLVNQSNCKEELRKEFDKYFPGCKGKKLVLYAPTFRDDFEQDSALLKNTDFEKVQEILGNDFALLLKLHPRVHCADVPNCVTDVTNCDIAKLSVICDCVITDYSSVCMDFAFLNKPCYFYAFDLDNYKNDRDFCFGYEDYVPGLISDDLCVISEEIKNPQSDEKLSHFREFNFDYIDGENCKRIYEGVISANL